MNQTEIYIHGKKVDLFPDTEVGFTFHRNNFKEVKTRQFSYSTDFRLPLTKNNIRLIGHANRFTSGSSVPYRYIPCQILSKGLHVTENAFMQIVSVSDDIEAYVIEGSVPFWKAIKGKSCRDAYGTFDESTSYINGLRTANRMYNFNTFSGDNPRVCYPVAYYGAGLQFDEGDNTWVMDNRYQYPAVFVSDIVNQIITKAGYTLESNLIYSQSYKNLAILYGGPDDDIDAYGVDNLIPDIEQKDFLKFVGFMFGQDFIEDSNRTNVIITKPFDQPFNATPLDWSGKINHRKAIKLERFWGEWAKNNLFVYDNDDYEYKVGQCVLKFNNQSIEDSYEAFRVPFSASRNIYGYNNLPINPVWIKRINSIDEETGDVEKVEDQSYRLVSISRAQFRVKYVDKFTTSGLLQTSFVPYASFTPELELKNVIDTKYMLLKSIFGTPLKITAEFWLSSSDIASLNLDQLIYIDESYRGQQITGLFVIASINNYVPNTPTEVELIEVGGQAESAGIVTKPEPAPAGFLVDNLSNFAVDASGNKVLNDEKP